MVAPVETAGQASSEAMADTAVAAAFRHRAAARVWAVLAVTAVVEALLAALAVMAAPGAWLYPLAAA